MTQILVLVCVGMLLEVFFAVDVVVRGRSRQPAEVRTDRM